MREFDPNGLFLNNFGRRLMGIGNKLDADPAAKRCALLDYCLCSSDNDCGKTQYCGTVPGYPNKPVCRTTNDHKVNEQIVAYKPTDDLFGWLMRNFPFLFAKANLQCKMRAMGQLTHSLGFINNFL
jgi:hypothetical protein